MTFQLACGLFVTSIIICLLPHYLTKLDSIRKIYPFVTVYAAGFLLGVMLLDFIPHITNTCHSHSHSEGSKNTSATFSGLLTSGLTFIALIGIDSLILKHSHCDHEHLENKQCEDHQHESTKPRNVVRSQFVSCGESPAISGNQSITEAKGSDKNKLSEQNTHPETISCSDHYHNAKNEHSDTLLSENNTSHINDTSINVNSDINSITDHHHAQIVHKKSHDHGNSFGTCNTKALQHSTNITQALIYVLAISIHSFFEGLAIRDDTSGSVIIGLLIHKAIESFTIGVTIAGAKELPNKTAYFLYVVYSLLTPLGMILVEKYAAALNANITIKSICDGLALGSTLFIVCIEMIPPLFHSQCKYSHDVLKISLLAVGFLTTVVLIYLNKKLGGHDHSHHDHTHHEKND